MRHDTGLLTKDGGSQGGWCRNLGEMVGQWER